MSRLFVVSNRVAPIEEGKMSAGGLSVAVADALSEVGGLWFGWSGKVVGSGSIQVHRVTKGPITYATIPLIREGLRPVLQRLRKLDPLAIAALPAELGRKF